MRYNLYLTHYLVLFMSNRSKNSIHTSNYALSQLVLICVLLFGVFHVSYQHDDLLQNANNHEQGCEYCSFASSSTTLPSCDIKLDLFAQTHTLNNYYRFLFQNFNFYAQQNPRAPPALA